MGGLSWFMSTQVASFVPSSDVAGAVLRKPFEQRALLQALQKVADPATRA